MKLLINIVLASTLALSLLISSINAEESKSSSNKNDTITTTLDVSSSSNSSQSLNSTKKESDTREKRNLSGFGSNFYNKNNNNNNYYSSVPKAAASTAQRRSSSGGYPFNSNYDFNSLDNNKNINNQKKHLHNNHLTSGPPHDFVKNQLSHGRAKHVIKNNQENGFNQHSANYYGHGPQYFEAPEPIIEIIIKDSNETYPIAAPLISSPKKKKKEEVQVYYVKYKHDQHHGLQVDVPVPAIAPSIHDDSSHEDEAQADEPVIVTLPPPRKATTIRAIIHPESEKFHAHGNVRVSFGSPPPLHRQENARQITEYNNEESALQPVLAHPNSPNSVPVDDAAYSKHDQYFDIQGRVVNNFNHVNQVPPPQKPSVNFNVNQVLPPQKPPVNFHPQQQFQHVQFSQGPARPQFGSQQQFNQPPPSQQHQQFLFHQSQQQQQQQRPQSSFQQQPQQHPPSHQQQFFTSGQRGQFPPHQLQLPTKQAVRFNNQPTSKFQFQQQQHKQPSFQTHQPRPIPIPLHQVQQQNNNQQQSFTNVRFNQPFTAFQSQSSQPPERRPETTRPTEPRPIIPTRSESVHFHSEQFVNNAQNQHQQQQQSGRPSQPQTTSVHQGLVQQQAPQNLAQQNPQLREHLQHLKYVLPAGGEVVASIPQYEHHITETIQNPPRSQFNQQGHQSQQVQQQQQQTQFHHHQQPQAQHSHRQEVTPPPLIHKQVTSSSNIGPLAHTIGHLSVGERQQFQPTTSRPVVQEFQRLPSHLQQQQQQPSFNGPQQFPSENVNFHHQFDSRPIQYQQNHVQQGSHQQFKVHHESVPLRNTFSVPFNHHAVEPLRDPSEPPLSSFLQGQQEPRRPDAFPNSLPLLQRPKPGQSVSTRYSDLFPSEFPNNHQQQQQQQQQQQFHQSNQQFSQGHFNQESSTTTTKRPITEAPKPDTTTKDYSLDLPDEVPDDLREQLLSSGILANAHISVLDYDKIGDTSLQDLPPEHLANFFNAGGGSQIAGSEKFETIVKPDGEKVAVQYAQTVKKHPQYKNADKPTLPKKEKVDLKVVRFDTTAQKSAVADKYIDTESTVLPTVDLNDQVYNRYLPLKINGAQFPIPDVAELKGRRISSVVVLAPVDSPDVAEDRSEGSEAVESKQIRFIAGDALKQLIKKPSTDNYRRWLEREGKTEVDLQSVVLLVTKNDDEEQEIFMYDIPTKAVNKLSGELSTAFVNVAEDNVTSHDIDGAAIYDSGIVEQVKPDKEAEVPEPSSQEQEDVKEEETSTEVRPPQSDNSAEYDTDMDMGLDASAEGSENLETIVKFDAPIETTKKEDDKHVENKVMISSGYSVIKS